MSESTLPITTLDADSLAVQIERNRENGYKDLDEKLKAFGIAYVTNGYDHRAAAKSIGRSENSGVRLKREPLLAAYINDLMNKYVAESLVRKETLDVYLENLEDIAMGRIETIGGATDADGNLYDAKKFHSALALKIFQERAKLHGIIKEDTKGGGGVNVTINMAGMFKEEKPPAIEIEGEIISNE